MAETTAGITAGALARRLGVSPTTIRSWEQRYGIGPASRAAGRHRRWSPSDVAMLEEMCRLTSSGVPPAEAARAARRSRPAPAGSDERLPGRGTVDAEGAGRGSAGGGVLALGNVRQECRGLARAAVRLDAAAMERLLQQAISDRGLVSAWEDVMAPTLRAVGRKWVSSGDLYVEVEHLLSWQVSTALRRAALTATDRSRAPVLLACVPAEPHTLPLEALAAALSERGLEARMFGGAVPAEALEWRPGKVRSGAVPVLCRVGAVGPVGTRWRDAPRSRARQPSVCSWRGHPSSWWSAAVRPVGPGAMSNGRVRAAVRGTLD
ncbi:MerR family transcriptional regulator [Streptomyces sp. NPDC014746]|uniref:MerR family transcriptional regulator n=1 Tax=Streptomyces sp. NPDC014746 TaxID=3364904 RepID=UPI0036FD8C6D